MAPLVGALRGSEVWLLYSDKQPLLFLYTWHRGLHATAYSSTRDTEELPYIHTLHVLPASRSCLHQGFPPVSLWSVAAPTPQLLGSGSAEAVCPLACSWQAVMITVQHCSMDPGLQRQPGQPPRWHHHSFQVIPPVFWKRTLPLPLINGCLKPESLLARLWTQL